MSILGKITLCRCENFTLCGGGGDKNNDSENASDSNRVPVWDPQEGRYVFVEKSLLQKPTGLSRFKSQGRRYLPEADSDDESPVRRREARRKVQKVSKELLEDIVHQFGVRLRDVTEECGIPLRKMKVNQHTWEQVVETAGRMSDFDPIQVQNLVNALLGKKDCDFVPPSPDEVAGPPGARHRPSLTPPILEKKTPENSPVHPRPMYEVEEEQKMRERLVAEAEALARQRALEKQQHYRHGRPDLTGVRVTQL